MINYKCTYKIIPSKRQENGGAGRVYRRVRKIICIRNEIVVGVKGQKKIPS